MSVIQYKCDICNRVIDIPQNRNGLEIMNYCIITDGCYGKLSQIDVKFDHIRGSFPDRVENLNDYTRRKTLYKHAQTIKLFEWNIVHNLGVSPYIQVFVERPIIPEDIENIDENNLVKLVEVIPDYINISSINEVIIGFNKPEKGIAQLISKTTNKSEISKVRSVPTNDISYTQISTSSEITIGTISSDLILTLNLVIYSPNGESKTILYTIDDNPSIKSPWINFNKVYNGKTYTVRSFNLFDEDFSNIENGSTFSIINPVTGLQFNKNELIFLLSGEPYSTNDKILDKYLDIYDIDINSINTTLYNNGELSINDQKLIKIYPYIKEV